MARTTTHCSLCPAAGKKTHNTMLMHPLFHDEAMDWPPSDPDTQRQARALREAIAPYLCIADLRRLAASGENIQAVLKSMEDTPEEVQALVSLLQALLAPCRDERITQPADLAALLMLEMGYLQRCAKRLSYQSLLAFFNWNVATMAEPPTRILSRDSEQGLADGFLKRFPRSGSRSSQIHLELGEGLFDGREVGRIAR